MPFKDEEVYLTEDQKLNGYQPFKLVLEAGGSASYDFPTNGNQTYGYIVPAENDGGDYYNVRLLLFYCSSTRIHYSHFPILHIVYIIIALSYLFGFFSSYTAKKDPLL